MDLRIKCINTTTDSDGSQYGKFVIEPLDRGFGTTIGNSLRRVLISSLEGAAVTSMRIEGITHEYTSIPGVVEDVIDIMLNMKGLVFKTETHEAQHIRLDIDKPGPVLGSDLKLPSGLKVVNPDWLICTVAEGGEIHADIIVETGKGYITNDIVKDTKGQLPIDMLPIDATFMPIKRVSYNVDAARVGDSMDYDRLTLEIWSNGSIEVTAALSQASQLLIEQFSQIAAITGQPSLFTDITSNDIIEEPRVETPPTITIEDLELSVRAYNCLKRASINSLPELLKKSEHDLLNIKNFGKKSSDEVIEKLRECGLDLAPNPEGFDSSLVE